MNLSSARIKTLVFATALLPCVSCTAGATKDTPEDKSVCLEIGQLLDPLHVFLNDEMATLLAHSSDKIAYGVTPELLGDLTSLITCTTRLTELELKDKTAINRERCDPFPISVTLSGLEESLKEVDECRTHACTLDQISLKKEVMQHQTDRLKMLAKKCSEF
jgi:hypothetical protein